MGIGYVVAIDVAVVVGWTILVGATAPHWPRRWVDHDWGPLRIDTAWETPEAYRRLGAARLSRLIPDAGSWLGGRRKSPASPRDPDAVREAIVELRRGELVHLVTPVCWLALPWFNPWQLSVVFAGVVITANLPCGLVIRYNRLRWRRVAQRLGIPTR